MTFHAPARQRAEIAITGEIISSGTFDTLRLELVFERMTLATSTAPHLSHGLLKVELAAAIREGRPALFCREGVSADGFKDLEYFCRQVRLSYRRTIYGAGAFSTVTFWHPGMEEPGEVEANNGGCPVVPAAALLDLLSLPAEAVQTELDMLLVPYQLAAGVGLMPALTASRLVAADKMEA